MSLFDQYLQTREETNKTMSERIKQPTGNQDPRLWKPTFHKDTGTGYAIIRFLPGTNPAELPYAKTFSHYFKGASGAVYWEQSLTTLGEKDPVGELNSRLWNTGDEKMQNIARGQKRKVQYVANVQVIKDPDNPDAEGKVFLYKFGQSIFDKIDAALNPKFEDKEKLNPFDIINGAPFTIRIQEKDGWQNYDESEFTNRGPIAESQDEMKAIFEEQHDLAEFTDPANFKSYDELKDKMTSVLADEWWANDYLYVGSSTPAQSAPATQSTNSGSEDKMSGADFMAQAESSSSSDDSGSSPSADSSDGGDDDDMQAFFDALDD